MAMHADTRNYDLGSVCAFPVDFGPISHKVSWADCSFPSLWRGPPMFDAAESSSARIWRSIPRHWHCCPRVTHDPRRTVATGCFAAPNARIDHTVGLESGVASHRDPARHNNQADRIGRADRAFSFYRYHRQGRRRLSGRRVFSLRWASRSHRYFAHFSIASRFWGEYAKRSWIRLIPFFWWLRTRSFHAAGNQHRIDWLKAILPGQKVRRGARDRAVVAYCTSKIENTSASPRSA
jgi:hypothetical protein